jgi:molybdenum cofactor cytidylyltransferase
VTIAALLLAAGESTRMGRLKQLLPWEGEPLVAWQARQLRDAGVDEVVVVLGHAAEEIAPWVPAFARAVVNAAYREGRATSLRRGAEALGDEVEAVVILSVDQPRPAWVTRKLIERWGAGPHPSPLPLRYSAGDPEGEGTGAAPRGEAGTDGRPLVVSPRFSRGFGHPNLLDGSLIAELREVDEATLGLRAVIDRHVDRAVSVSIPNDAVNVDLNTAGDYEVALAAFESGKWAEV